MTRVRLPLSQVDIAHRTTAERADRESGDGDGHVTHAELDAHARRATASSSSVDAVRAALDQRGAELSSTRAIAVSDVDARLRAHAEHVDRYDGDRDGHVTGGELSRFAARVAHDGAQLAGVVRPLREILLSDKARDVSGPAPPPPPSTRDALVARLVKSGGSATVDDVAAVRASLAALPVEVLTLMEKRGITVVACRDSVTDHLAHLRGVTPRGWPPGSTWDSVPGCFEPGKKEVVVGTKSGPAGTRVVPGDGHGHGASNLTLHELAHGLDYTNPGGRFSSTDAGFLAAYTSDLPTIRATDPYLAQPAPAGPEEAFAETMSLFLVDRHELERWPALHTWWTILASRGFDFTRGGVA